MKNTSCFNHLRRHGAVAAITAALAVVTPLAAQTTATSSSKNMVSDDEGEYARWNISLFGGAQFFQIGENPRLRPLDFNLGPELGVSVTEDLTRHFGVEEDFAVALNRATFLPYGDTFRPDMGSRNYQASLLAVYNFAPRGAKFRPFVLVGPGTTFYQPYVSSFHDQGTAILPTSMHGNFTPAIWYGYGVKYQVNKNFGLRLDVRGMWSRQPTFGLPVLPGTTQGTIYVPQHGSESALEETIGVVFNYGFHEPPPPPPAPAPPPPPPPVAISSITGAHDVCPGENLGLSVTASGGAQPITYQWSVNGSAAAGATSNSFMVPTNGGAGSRSITVTATSGSDSKTSGPVSVRIKSSAMPTIRFTLAQSTIAFGDKVPLSATATGSECTDPVRISYSASEGSISGNTYDSSGVSFDMSNRLRQQSKTITITATATDAKGETARATANLDVTLTPQATRYDDIVFPKNNARVNNCGKRILLEQVTPVLKNDPQAKVILIGHFDSQERASLKLDNKRVLNAAAILSAGTGICPSLDLSRILVHDAGTDQASQTRPSLCGSSVTERAGSSIPANDDRAQYRRVEVWVVPGGAEMPAGTSGFSSAPEKETKALKCPR